MADLALALLVGWVIAVRRSVPMATMGNTAERSVHVRMVQPVTESTESVPANQAGADHFAHQSVLMGSMASGVDISALVSMVVHAIM